MAKAKRKPDVTEGDNFPSIKGIGLQVALRPTTSLVPYGHNARTHSPEQIDILCKSLTEFGWTNPILVDGDNGVVAGHGRLMAALKLGIADVPCIELSHLTPAQRRAYVIADNQTALRAGWDLATLRLELGALQGEGFNLEPLGFSLEELGALLAPAGTQGLTDPDDVPEAPEHPTSIPGDLWALGRHWLLCGDSTSAEDTQKVMAGAEGDFVFTSPPYSQQRKYGFKNGIEDWDALMQGVFSVLPMKVGAQVFVNLGMVHKDNEWQPYWSAWIEWMRSAGWRSFGWYIWDQGPGLPGDWNGRLAPSHEFIFHFNHDAQRANKTKEKKPESIQVNNHGSGMRKADGKMSGISSPMASLQTHKIPDSVIRVVRHKGRGIEVKHPAVFPVALVKEMSDAYTRQGDHLYEPFSGSGTTLLSAELTGRICHAIDINPIYIDIAIQRWQDFTGQKATLVDDGSTFEEIGHERSRKAA